MKSKKFLLLSSVLSVALISLVIIFIPGAKSAIQPYFNGEAISFRGEVVFGTTNTGRLEVFALTNGQIEGKSLIYSDEDRKFSDLIFSVENDYLFVYLVNGRYLYKYDLTNLFQPSLIEKVSDSSGDYFYGLGQAGDNIFTIGNKGLKVWNKDLQVVNAFKDYDFKYPKSVNLSVNGDYLFNANGGRLNVFDTFYRDQILNIDLNIKDNHSLHPFIDDAAGLVFVVDDYSLKKVNIDGTYSEFKHISNIGYDVDGNNNQEFVYFSDGIGIVKTRISDLHPEKWAFTTNLGVSNGWAMGLRVVENYGQDFVVVFNGSSILVFDQDLNLIDFYEAREAINFFSPLLALSVDRNRAARNSLISLHGRGFGLNEELKIKFDHEFYYTFTDNQGGFETFLTVPDNGKRGYTDIKVEGSVSKLTYSMSFYIE